MTVPNLITTLRIILAPIFIIYLINDQFLPGLIVFIICSVSDGVDGFVARVFNQKSRLGTYLDPIADKLILVSAFIALAIQGSLPAWLTVLAISRDILILLGVFVLFIIGSEFNINPSIASKITTCLQFSSVIAVLLKNYIAFFSGFYIYLFYVTGFFTIISGLHYLRQWFKIIGEDSGDD